MANTQETSTAPEETKISQENQYDDGILSFLGGTGELIEEEQKGHAARVNNDLFAPTEDRGFDATEEQEFTTPEVLGFASDLLGPTNPNEASSSSVGDISIDEDESTPSSDKLETPSHSYDKDTAEEETSEEVSDGSVETAVNPVSQEGLTTVDISGENTSFLELPSDQPETPSQDIESREVYPEYGPSEDQTKTPQDSESPDILSDLSDLSDGAGSARRDDKPVDNVEVGVQPAPPINPNAIVPNAEEEPIEEGASLTPLPQEDQIDDDIPEDVVPRTLNTQTSPGDPLSSPKNNAPTYEQTPVVNFTEVPVTTTPDRPIKPCAPAQQNVQTVSTQQNYQEQYVRTGVLGLGILPVYARVRTQPQQQQQQQQTNTPVYRTGPLGLVRWRVR